MVVTATTGYGSTPASSAPTDLVSGAPVNTSLPTISGTAKEGQTLSASTGSWDNPPADSSGYSYQWRDCDPYGSNCSDIAGANSDSYTPVFADAESTIRVVVTADNGYGTTAATSAQTALVNSLNSFAITATTSSPTAGQADGLTLTALDPLGNTVTSYSGSQCLLFSGPAASPNGTAPSYPAQGSCPDGQSAVSFSNGVAGASVTFYKASSSTILVSTDASSQRAGALPLNVVAAGIDKLSLAAVSATPRAGSPDNLTITALDAYGNTATSYTGSHSLSFSGASAIANSPFSPSVSNASGMATSFGTATALTFTNGVAATAPDSSNGAMTLYKLGSASITVAESGSHGSSALAVNVASAASSVAAGGFHTCALMSYGGVECWGEDNYGQLGNNSTTNSSTPVAVNIKAIAISSGRYGSCAVASGGTVWCWGSNAYGQLGNNSTTDSHLPVQVLAVGGTGYLTNAVAVTTGAYSSCALLATGAVDCWGRDNYGQLGINSTTDSHFPVQVHGVGNSGTLAGITAISAGDSHVCAVRSTGSVYCWGRNNYGQIGDNSTSTRKTPVQVRAISGSGYLANIKAVSAGRYHTCAVLGSGVVDCWGYNYYGQLGNNSSSRYTSYRRPVQVYGISTATKVSVGEYQSCALLSSGAVDCWGYDNYGQLGNNSTTLQRKPVAVSGISGATQVSAGGQNTGSSDYAHSCALLSDGTIRCWGYNGYGEVGDGTTTTPRLVPVVVGLL